MVGISDDVPGGDSPAQEEIDAFQTAARDLIGVALRSLDVLAGQVSLPQFRMLLALRDLGRCPSSHVAQALGLGASSVTRLADRLHVSGHIARGADAHHRGVVTLELTALGHHVVSEVLDWRHQEFARILARLEPGQRAATAEGLRAFHQVVGDGYAADVHGPVPL
ncbi:MarR family winged helix-turn-helix transcriptional regulator [Kitasatospora mediocidica]|uniref:MarR family winged helix-turn-helix transcriptional regulator n=1 Tax=Kitasatospora mediocidica TaxID=58352 RepID=UPI00056A1938|nr:MarR family winged helix-turn-helix transcriptional regulator [Kitasatospora mediocidica]